MLHRHKELSVLQMWVTHDLFHGPDRSPGKVQFLPTLIGLHQRHVGKEVFYALDEGERQGIVDRVAAEKLPGKVVVQRFKGLGEMNPIQLRETAMAPDTRRLVQLWVGKPKKVIDLLDMLLSKKRAPDRKTWLEKKGDLAEIN